MRLYDTATSQQLEVKPVDGEVYRFYCCGPTVYAPAHIGNFRTFVVQDVFRRTLEIGGTATRHVRNLTDVDDKTIRGAIEARMSLKSFTDQWVQRFHDDCESLNCLSPHVEPSAVEHLPHQIAMIHELIEKGHAYLSDDQSVYFRISSFETYGALAKLDQQELELGKTQNQRVCDADEYEKDSIADFVLWKARRKEDGDHFWESPWGEGRPGWHIECSAMIREHLGITFDLHAGGVDLIFPHHENERAQSKSAFGGEFARHWFHVAHLFVDGGKMSKSLGNYYTLDCLTEKGYTTSEVRYALMGAHYRKPLNFTLSTLHAAKEALAKLSKAQYDFQQEYEVQVEYSYDELRGTKEFGIFQPAWDVLQYDLNTQAAIGKMFAQLKRLKGLSATEGETTWRGWNALLAALGVVVPRYSPPIRKEILIPEGVQKLAQQRFDAKRAKDWEEADRLRSLISESGWSIVDSSDGYHLEQST